MNVQDIFGTKNEDCSVGAVNKVPSGIIDVLAIVETIILDSDEEQKDEDDNDFEAEPP